MKKYIDESLVFDSIKAVVYKMCPVKEPRVKCDERDYSYEKEELEIDFYFHKDENEKIKTSIIFMKNNEMFLDEGNYIVNDKISNDTIGNLIEFLIINFPYVNSMNTEFNEFKIEFGIGLEHHDSEGIGCSKVVVSFNTYPSFWKDFENIFSGYLKYITDIFKDYIGKNPECANRFRGYYNLLKPKMVVSFDSEQLQQLVGLLTDEEIRMLLLKMNNERFFQLCDSLKNRDNEVGRKSYRLSRKPIGKLYGTRYRYKKID